jgi:hypothetical protein
MRIIRIIGGGTSGWMTALLLHKLLRFPCEIHLVESTTINTIGVGEGTTPFIKQFFELIGVREHEWMPLCNATFKCGIRFPNWSTVKGYESYYHPFYSHFDKEIGEAFFINANIRRRGIAVDANPTDFFVAPYLSSKGLAPKTIRPLPFDMDYAYHFDAGLLGDFLKELALKRGISHHLGTVKKVHTNQKIGIESVQLENGLCIKGDYFFDCSGFCGLLIEKALFSPFSSYTDNLLNNSAIAIQTQYEKCNHTKLLSETRSEALSNGWMWQIPLQTRQGNGYVFSDDFITPAEAERELRDRLNVDDKVQAKHLKMRIGRRELHWIGNCFAVGLSQGFIEPLEATALMLVQYSIQLYAHALNRIEDDTSHKLQFETNEKINKMFDGVRDYIVAHYKTNSRSDSDYWKVNRHETPISSRLNHILRAWRSGEEIEPILKEHQADLVYLRPSWYCLLAGMGQFPTKLKPDTLGAGNKLAKIVSYCEQIRGNFTPQKNALQRV